MRIIKYGGSVCGKEEEKALIQSIKSSILSGNWQAGEQARLMEEEAARFLGIKYGILTTSGSCAGLLALASLELAPGSEVIISATTFPTIFNIILQLGLVPVVVDSKIGTYNFDIAEVASAITKKTGAIIAIHAVGNPVDMPGLMAIARKRQIPVIEDGCDTWGGSIDGKMIGSFGDLSITSFHAAHIVSMGVGGGIFTDNPKLAANVRMYRDWGRQANITDPHKCKTLPKDYNPRFVYEKIGYNFQILELQAAMGRIQLKKAKEIKKKRQKNFDYLNQALSVYEDLILPDYLPNADICWFAFPITYNGDRSALVAHLEKKGIETRSMFAGNIIRHPAYRKSKYRVHGKLHEADYILEHSFWISLHPRLTHGDLKYIVSAFNTFFNGTHH